MGTRAKRRKIRGGGIQRRGLAANATCADVMPGVEAGLVNESPGEDHSSEQSSRGDCEPDVCVRDLREEVSGEIPDPASNVLSYQPFPVECLPDPIKNFVVANARAMGCDESFLALPALAVLAGAIGNSARIRLKESWSEPSILWTAVVADSGTRKSPPLEAVIKPMQYMQMIANWTFQQEMAEFPRKLDQYRSDLALAAHAGVQAPPKPKAPVDRRFLVGDIALEPLLNLLSRQRRGLLVCRDELDGWLGNFDASRGKGAGPAQWLEFHGGRPMLIERRRGKPATLEIEHASVSVTGGIQPEILASRLTKSHLACGLFARLLFAFPPARSRRWSEADVDRRVSAKYTEVLKRLLAFPNSAEGVPSIRACEYVELTDEAKRCFIEFINDFGQEQDDADEALAASFAKLEGYAARFALVLHLTRWAGSSEPNQINPLVCDRQDIENGIKLTRWFAHETKRVRALLCETPEETNQRKLIGWLHRRGGQGTARELARSSTRRYPTMDEARTALNGLVEAGVGSWVDRPAAEHGRRPQPTFVLFDLTPQPGHFVGHVAQESSILHEATA